MFLLLLGIDPSSFTIIGPQIRKNVLNRTADFYGMKC